MARIFISHNSNDAKEAAALKRWLTDNGWDDVFLDLDAKDGLKPGEKSWKGALTNAIDRCEAVLCLVSPTWLASKECEVEYRYAENKKKSIFLLPIKACDPTGHVSSDLQWSPLFGDGVQTTITFVFRGQPTECTFLADGLERLKYGLIKAGIIADYFAWPPENDPDRAPYRGLNPLEAEDAAVFFGRDARIKEGMEYLQNMREGGSKRLLVILGSSGSGKSSFMRAGLLPRLKRDDRHFFPLPVIRPRNAVISGPDGLAQSLARAFEEIDCNITLGRIEQELDLGLQAFTRLMVDLKQRLFERVKGEVDAVPPSIVIPIDQGEELFDPAGAQEAELFLAFLAYLLDELNTDAGQPVSTGSLARVLVLLTIRSDRYEQLQHTQGLSSINPELFDLKPIPPDQFERVINGPAERATRSGRKLMIEPSLAERLLEDFKEGADTLPLLGFALEKLYLKFGTDGDLTLEEYQRIRGKHETVQAAIFEEAIKTVLQELYPSPATPEERKKQEQTLRPVFIPYLVRIDTKNDEPMRQVAKLGDSPEELPEKLLPFVERLVKARLLTQAKGDTIEVAHESLLRQWPSLYGWITEERDNLRLLGSIRQSAADWKKEQRTDDRRDGLLVHQDARLADALTLLAMPGYVVSADSIERAYLNACIGKQKKRVAKERRTARAILVLLVVALCVAGVAIRYYLEAERQLIVSEAQVLWHPLDFSNNKVNPEKADGLLKLAQSEDSRKREFLNQLLMFKKHSDWFNQQPHAILAAAVGVDPKRRDWFNKRLIEFAPDKEEQPKLLVTRALGLVELDGKLTPEDLIAAIEVTHDSDQLRTLGQGAVVMADRVPAVEAVAAVTKFVVAIQDAHDRNQLAALGQGLVAVVIKVPVTEAVAEADKLLVAASQATRDAYDEQLPAFAQGLAALADRVPEIEVGALVDKLLSASKITRDNQYIQTSKRQFIGESLAVLARKVPSNEAAKVTKKFLAAIMDTQDSYQLLALGQGVAAVATRVPKTEAAEVAKKFVAAILHTDIQQVEALGQGLTAIASKVSEDKTLYTPDIQQIEALSQGLAAVASNVSEEAEAGAIAITLLTAIQATPEQPDQLLALAKGVAALPGTLPGTDIMAVVTKFLIAIQDTWNQYDDQQKTLMQGMAAVAGKVPETEAPEVAELFLAAIQETPDPNQLQALAEGVAALPGTVPGTDAKAVAANFLGAIENVPPGSVLYEALTQAIAVVAKKVPETEADAIVERLLAEIRATLEFYQKALVQGAVEEITMAEAQSGIIPERFLDGERKARRPAFQLEALSRVVAALPGKVSEAQARAADWFLPAIQDAPSKEQLELLGRGVTALAGKVPGKEAGAMAEKWLAATISTTMNLNRRRVLCQGAAALASRVQEKDAEAVATLFLAAILNTDDPDQLKELGHGVAAMVGRVPKAEAEAIAAKFLTAIKINGNFDQLPALALGLAAVTPAIGDDNQAAILLFEALKYPLIPRDTITDAIRKRFPEPETPPKEKGFWALIEWADKKHFRRFDLEAPLPQSPNIAASTTPSGKPKVNEIKRD